MTVDSDEALTSACSVFSALSGSFILSKGVVVLEVV